MRAGQRSVLAALALAAVGFTAGCGGAQRSASAIPRRLLLEARPIGRGAAFHPPPRGPVVGTCTRRLGQRSEAHVELFAANRVVIVAAGIGVRPPLALAAGRVVAARCYGAVVTLDPTGVVLVRPSARLSVAALFRAWGQPLSTSRLGPFRARAGASVAAFVDGRRWRGPPGAIPLTSHAEIVLEVGPYVPPHASYTFAPVP